MLSPSELRRLREIERGLWADDPSFAGRIEARSRPDGRSFAHLYALAGIGMVITVFGPLVPACYPVGLSAALAAVTVRLGTSWLDRRRQAATKADLDSG